MRTTMRFMVAAALCCAALAAPKGKADTSPSLVSNATTPCVRACGGPKGAGNPAGNATKGPGPKGAGKPAGNATKGPGPKGAGGKAGNATAGHSKGKAPAGKGNVTAGSKGPRANATGKGPKGPGPNGPAKSAKLGGNVTAGPKGSKKGAKQGNTTAKGPKAGKAGKMGNSTAKGGKAPKGGVARRNVTTMEVSLPMPPGDCEKQTAAEVKANVGVIANATGQAALLDLAASEGKCTAAASASSRARRATKDNFAVSLAFKDTVTPAQYASAVEATGAVIAAGNFSVSLGVGGAAKTVVMPKEAKVTQGIRATEAGGSGPEDPGEAEGSGAAATGGVAALLGVALALAGLV